ncbi:unnamed protein product [Bursaphelenchus xylophilus]|uniref:(pine wood nematode) hypothetical protein n=1 Tax=Bursaphelenchus xylophilus TaxID=6326 RepID=A0A1I7SEA4_BURXY|nr:unnamed protein product [Bursaphelenchus xylophilus]CAG9087385.1 unnamed protein product [Bursaphelenchus xylophilus]
MNRLSLLVVFAFACFANIEAFGGFSSNFYNFLVQKYGKEYADKLNRRDIQKYPGSFGGGPHVAGEKMKKIPTVFVHGYSNGAYIFFFTILPYLGLRGYSFQEMYGTSYGTYDPNKGMDQTGVNCEYILMNRRLIQAVSEFTNSTVNVVSVSTGGPVVRKAILGGKCVETGEDLGAPISHLVNVYISVCGANHGAGSCQQVGAAPICNKINGLACESKIFPDINAVGGYEGKKRYVIESMADDVVFFKACGTKTMEFKNMTGKYVLRKLTHAQTFTQTFALQYRLLSEQ